MARERTPSKQDADRLYERYVEPLEREHRGKYVTVNLCGDTIVSPSEFLAILEQQAPAG